VNSARAAYCDVDGTLSATQIVSPLIFFRRRLMPQPLRALWLGCLPLRAAYWMLLDKFSRDASNRAIYAGYAGLDVARVKALTPECYRSYLQPRLLGEGLSRLERLKEEGVELVLVTGSLDLLMKPLAERLGAELVAPSLKERDGRFTGQLTGPAMTGERKALAVRTHAQRFGIEHLDEVQYVDHHVTARGQRPRKSLNPVHRNGDGCQDHHVPANGEPFSNCHDCLSARSQSDRQGLERFATTAELPAGADDCAGKRFQPRSVRESTEGH